MEELSPAELERLALLAEECAEVIHRINKVIRHGYESTHKDKTNREGLVREIGHVRFAISLMEGNGDIDRDGILHSWADKCEDVLPWLHYKHKGLRKC